MYSPYDTALRLLRQFDIITIKEIYSGLDEGKEDREIARMLKMHPSNWSRIKPLIVKVLHVPSEVMMDVMQKENNIREFDAARVHNLIEDTQEKLRLIYANGEYLREDNKRA